MNREEAIKIIIDFEISHLSTSEKIEILQTMMLENWSECTRWKILPKDVRKEFDEGRFKYELCEQDTNLLNCYDDVIFIYLNEKLIGVNNEYLIEKLRKLGRNIDSIIGSPIILESCPCCGRRTIEERGTYDICQVCWWEDDGSDNETAYHYSGANNLSLVRGRFNYIKYGIYDPKRTDLMRKKQSEKMYSIGRVFYLKDDFTIAEKDSVWSSRIDAGEDYL